MRILILTLIIILNTGCESCGWESVDTRHYHTHEVRYIHYDHHYYDHHHHRHHKKRSRKHESKPLPSSHQITPPSRPERPPTSRSISKGVPTRQPSRRERE